MVLLRLCWWIKGWKEIFPYSPAEVIRNPRCLSWVDHDPNLSLRLSRKKEIVDDGKIHWLVAVSSNSSLKVPVIGGALLNNNKKLLCLFSRPIPLMDHDSAMVLAIHRAVQISLSSDRIKNHPIDIRAGSHLAVQWCSNTTGGPVNLNFILNFIRSAPGRGLRLSFSANQHCSNSVEDLIANQGLLRNSDFVVWKFWFLDIVVSYYSLMLLMLWLELYELYSCPHWVFWV